MHIILLDVCRWDQLHVVVIEYAFLILQPVSENLVTLDDTNASAVLQKDGTVVCTHEILSPIGNVMLIPTAYYAKVKVIYLAPTCRGKKNAHITIVGSSNFLVWLSYSWHRCPLTSLPPPSLTSQLHFPPVVMPLIHPPVDLTPLGLMSSTYMFIISSLLFMLMQSTCNTHFGEFTIHYLQLKPNYTTVCILSKLNNLGKLAVCYGAHCASSSVEM